LEKRKKSNSRRKHPNLNAEETTWHHQDDAQVVGAAVDVSNTYGCWCYVVYGSNS
jgi:hypothetical protein